MILRIMGAVLILSGSGIFGFMLAAAYRKEITALSELLEILNTIECDLQYKISSLPVILKNLSCSKKGVVYNFCKNLSQELDTQIQPSVYHCVQATLEKSENIPNNTRKLLEKLGHSLGNFDVDGQILELHALKKESELLKEKLLAEQENKLRSYKTLALCAGAAIVIIFI